MSGFVGNAKAIGLGESTYLPICLDVESVQRQECVYRSMAVVDQDQYTWQTRLPNARRRVANGARRGGSWIWRKLEEGNSRNQKNDMIDATGVCCALRSLCVARSRITKWDASRTQNSHRKPSHQRYSSYQHTSITIYLLIDSNARQNEQDTSIDTFTMACPSTKSSTTSRTMPRCHNGSEQGRSRKRKAAMLNLQCSPFVDRNDEKQTLRIDIHRSSRINGLHKSCIDCFRPVTYDGFSEDVRLHPTVVAYLASGYKLIRGLLTPANC